MIIGPTNIKKAAAMDVILRMTSSFIWVNYAKAGENVKREGFDDKQKDTTGSLIAEGTIA
jgi:hypothetical protein